MSPFARALKRQNLKRFPVERTLEKIKSKMNMKPSTAWYLWLNMQLIFCRRYFIICTYRYFPASIYVNISCLQHTGGVDCNIKVLFSPPTNWLIAQGHSIVVVRFWTSKSDALCVKKRDGNTDIWLQHFGILNQKFWFRKHLDAAKLSSRWFFMVGQ